MDHQDSLNPCFTCTNQGNAFEPKKRTWKIRQNTLPLCLVSSSPYVLLSCLKQHLSSLVTQYTILSVFSNYSSAKKTRTHRSERNQALHGSRIAAGRQEALSVLLLFGRFLSGCGSPTAGLGACGFACVSRVMPLKCFPE